MRCGTCGSTRMDYFTWLGVTSLRCPDCGADVFEDFNNRLIESEPDYSADEYYSWLKKQGEEL